VTGVLHAILVLAVVAGPAVGSGELAGRVLDETGVPIEGAPVQLTLQDGHTLRTESGSTGDYEFRLLPAGRHQLGARLINFADVRREVIIGTARVRADIVLRPALSAHVVVTAPRTFRNLAEVPNPEESLVGLAGSASVGAVTMRQLQARPAMRAGEVLESVPGLIVTQHSGEGKANQYYLRGFNLDHGTDFATTVAGVPVNMPTHAHGHGYTDLNFLMPELVSGVQFRKGPYYADQGDFSAAGAANVSYVSRLDAPIVRASIGELGWQRGLFAASRAVGQGHLLYAGEIMRQDGPWERPDGYQRVNGIARYALGDSEQGAAIMLSAYHGVWHATDQVPQRAVTAGALGRFGTLDPTTGGRSYRYSLSAEAQRASATTSTHGSAYVLGYGLDLFSNFTYFLEDPAHGDQFEQRDARIAAGGRIVHRRLQSWRALAVENSYGTDVRHDAIGAVGLYRTEARRRRATVREDSVDQTSVGVFVQNETAWMPRLRTLLGLRADLFRFRVASDIAANSGGRHAGSVSPKASLVAGPWAATELYVNAGRGFHSNDARGTTIRIDPVTRAPVQAVTPLAAVTGAEIGVRTVAIPRAQLTAALWTLRLDSELLFVGDAGTTEAGGPSRRTGLELSAYAALASKLHVDADVALSHARFTDNGPAGPYVPGAARIVASAGMSVEDWGRVSAGVRWRYLGGRPLAEDGRIRSQPTSTVNAQLSYAIAPRLRLHVEVFNLLSAEVSDIDYSYVSRLPGEPFDGVADRHLHPMPPRAVRAGLTVGF
jgi:hypothetical protein